MCSRSGLFDGLPASIQAACEAQTLNPLMACGTGSARGPAQPAHGPARLDARTRRRATQSAPRSRRWTSHVAEARRFGQLHRLLRIHPPRHPRRPALPSRPAAAAQLQIRAHRLPRPRFVARRQRNAGAPPARPDQAQRRTAFPASVRRSFSTTKLEVGIYIAGGNPLGEPIPIDRAGEHIFGISLLNDWSARDIQSWEYQPLGPFLAKSFATSVSPWVVPMAALAPFRVPAAPRPAGDPAPLPYLFDADDQQPAPSTSRSKRSCSTATMRAAGLAPHRLSRANLRDLYWTPAQLIAHHTSNGCNLLPGDLLATGTVSGRSRRLCRLSARTDRAAARSPFCCPTAKPAPRSKTATRSSCAAFAGARLPRYLARRVPRHRAARA